MALFSSFLPAGTRSTDFMSAGDVLFTPSLEGTTLVVKAPFGDAVFVQTVRSADLEAGALVFTFKDTPSAWKMEIPAFLKLPLPEGLLVKDVPARSWALLRAGQEAPKVTATAGGAPVVVPAVSEPAVANSKPVAAPPNKRKAAALKDLAEAAADAQASDGDVAAEDNAADTGDHEPAVAKTPKCECTCTTCNSTADQTRTFCGLRMCNACGLGATRGSWAEFGTLKQQNGWKGRVNNRCWLANRARFVASMGN